MGDDPIEARARHWRMKAEELRTVAEQMRNPIARASFLRMAESYERLADRLASRAKAEKESDAG